MKVAYLSTFYPFRGGIAQFNASLFKALTEQQHKVLPYTFTRQYPSLLFPGKTQYVQPTDTLAEAIDSYAVLDTINPFTYYRTARIIRRFSPDILLMKYWMPFFSLSLGTVAKKMHPKTKIISILDNVIPHESGAVDKTLTRYFLRHNDGLVVMSDAVKKDLDHILPTQKPTLLIEHPNYNHFGKPLDKKSAISKLGLSPKRKTLLFFGFIRSYKGLDVLIEAFSKLDNDTYQLVIAGECYGSFHPYQRLIDAAAYKQHIYVHNRYIRDAEVPTFFSAADVCMLPYQSATQSGIMSIAQHFNLPSIVTRKGGLAENIIPNETGLVVEDTDAGLLSEKIKKYFDTKVQARFSEQIALLNKQNSWEQFAMKITDFAKTIKK